MSSLFSAVRDTAQIRAIQERTVNAHCLKRVVMVVREVSLLNGHASAYRGSP